MGGRGGITYIYVCNKYQPYWNLSVSVTGTAIVLFIAATATRHCACSLNDGNIMLCIFINLRSVHINREWRQKQYWHWCQWQILLWHHCNFYYRASAQIAAFWSKNPICDWCCCAIVLWHHCIFRSTRRTEIGRWWRYYGKMEWCQWHWVSWRHCLFYTRPPTLLPWNEI